MPPLATLDTQETDHAVLQRRLSGAARPTASTRGQVVDLTVDAASDDHPVTVTLKDAGGVNWWVTRSVRANDVVGCDGAHCAVRKAIGGVLHGDAAHQAWGVMDILANTDFPDVRQQCLIPSATEANVLVLPREGGYVLRMYVALDKVKPDEKAASRKLTQDDMIAAANRILRPCSIDGKEVVWWSIDDIGHGITDTLPPAGTRRWPAAWRSAGAFTPRSAIDRLADWLERDPKSPVVRHRRDGEDIDAVIDLRAVFQQAFDQLACEYMPSLLKPRTGKLGRTPQGPPA